MKTSGVCPKCNGREIYTNTGKLVRGDLRILPVSAWRNATLDQYICAKCGYVETYLSSKNLNDSSFMEKLRSAFKPR